MSSIQEIVDRHVGMGSREEAEEYVAALVESGVYADYDGAAELVARVNTAKQQRGGSLALRRLREKGRMA